MIAYDHSRVLLSAIDGTTPTDISAAGGSIDSDLRRTTLRSPVGLLSPQVLAEASWL